MDEKTVLTAQIYAYLRNKKGGFFVFQNGKSLFIRRETKPCQVWQIDWEILKSFGCFNYIDKFVLGE